MKLPTVASNRTPGFTLIELLVVLLIIVILMAALMPLYSKVQNSARKEATQAMIMTLAGSLERYKVEFDCYPPTSPTGNEDDGSLFDFLNGKDNRGITANANTKRERHYEPFLTLGKEFMRNNESGRVVLVDSWGTPIRYFNCKEYVEEKRGDPKNCYNPTTFDLYSLGRDKKKDPDLVEPGSGEVKEKSKMKLVDDITNF